MIEAVIYDPGLYNPRRIQTSGVSCSWAVDGNGSLSAEVKTRDLHRFGLVRPKGKWITVEHPTAGVWGGKIGPTRTSGDGTTEIAADDWRSLFDRRTLPQRSSSTFAPAGALAEMAIAAAERDDHLWIVDRRFDVVGEPIELPWKRQELRRQLDSLASKSGQEWWIDPETRELSWEVRHGRDLTGSVQLVEGRHVDSDWRIPDDIADVVNELTGIPSNEAYAVTQALVVQDLASQFAVGLRQDSAVFTEGVTKATLSQAATLELRRRIDLGVSLELTVFDTDRCWSWFREGDSVAVLLPSASSQVLARVMRRAVDGGEMSLSCAIEDWKVLP
jgi:hypothetical protein